MRQVLRNEPFQIIDLSNNQINIYLSQSSTLITPFSTLKQRLHESLLVEQLELIHLLAYANVFDWNFELI